MTQVEIQKAMSAISEALEQVCIAQNLTESDSMVIQEGTIDAHLFTAWQALRNAERKLRPLLAEPESNPTFDNLFGTLGSMLNPLTIKQ